MYHPVVLRRSGHVLSETQRKFGIVCLRRPEGTLPHQLRVVSWACRWHFGEGVQPYGILKIDRQQLLHSR